MKTAEFKDLLGKHVLDAVDFGSTEHIAEWGDDIEIANMMSFRLDGVVYTAIEDPGDGYRSSMKALYVEGRGPMKNAFPPCEVLVTMLPDGEYNEINDCLEMVDTTTGQTVLVVGTMNCNDYYPYFASQFTPENLKINWEKK